MAAAEAVDLRAQIHENATKIWPDERIMIILNETLPEQLMVAQIQGFNTILLSGEPVSHLRPEIAYRSLLQRTVERLHAPAEPEGEHEKAHVESIVEKVTRWIDSLVD